MVTSINDAPLATIKVLDLTRLLPGPLCSQYLADLGAEVVKIEDVKVGDYARPSLRNVVNRGKKSLRLNLKTEQGKKVFLQLVRQSDVMLEGFRPGTMRRLGLDYEQLSAHNPHLVYCAISGFGQTGPYCQKAGHDINFQSITGVLNRTGTPEGPVVPGFLLADLAGGTLSTMSGVLAALLRAQRTGRGQMVDVSMSDSLLALSAVPIALLNENASPTARGMDMHTGGNAHYNIYETLDGRHLSVGAQEKQFWDRFCDAIGRPYLKDRHSADVNDNNGLKDEIRQAIRSKTSDAWMRIFERLDCCVFPVLDLDEVMSDPHFQEREGIHRGQDGYQVGLPFSLSGFSVDFERESPRQGAHSREILASLGYNDYAIQRMRKEGVIA